MIFKECECYEEAIRGGIPNGPCCCRGYFDQNGPWLTSIDDCGSCDVYKRTLKVKAQLLLKELDS